MISSVSRTLPSVTNPPISRCFNLRNLISPPTLSAGPTLDITRILCTRRERNKSNRYVRKTNTNFKRNKFNYSFPDRNSVSISNGGTYLVGTAQFEGFVFWRITASRLVLCNVRSCRHKIESHSTSCAFHATG
jgi:hypothetical protein